MDRRLAWFRCALIAVTVAGLWSLEGAARAEEQKPDCHFLSPVAQNADPGPLPANNNASPGLAGGLVGSAWTLLENLAGFGARSHNAKHPQISPISQITCPFGSWQLGKIVEICGCFRQSVS